MVSFTDNLNQADRNDRVIAERWDATFTLTKAEPTPEVLERLVQIFPQEKEDAHLKRYLMGPTRVYAFSLVASMLAIGQQPDSKKLLETGYLIRTTVYGNGKFGLADFKRQKATTFLLPFQVKCSPFTWHGTLVSIGRAHRENEEPQSFCSNCRKLSKSG